MVAHLGPSWRAASIAHHHKNHLMIIWHTMRPNSSLCKWWYNPYWIRRNQYMGPLRTNLGPVDDQYGPVDAQYWACRWPIMGLNEPILGMYMTNIGSVGSNLMDCRDQCGPVGAEMGYRNDHNGVFRDESGAGRWATWGLGPICTVETNGPYVLIWVLS